jgi:hypothetical protein
MPVLRHLCRGQHLQAQRCLAVRVTLGGAAVRVDAGGRAGCRWPVADVRSLPAIAEEAPGVPPRGTRATGSLEEVVGTMLRLGPGVVMAGRKPSTDTAIAPGRIGRPDTAEHHA